LAALDTDMTPQLNAYRAKRDLCCSELKGAFEFATPSGGFYVFPKIPDNASSATAFVERAIEKNLLVIPGGVFSESDTHFRISYAAPDDKIRQGCSILRSLAT
jgi:aspartate aminotransferase/aminotransferase